MDNSDSGHDLAGKRFAFLSHFYWSLYRFRLPIMKRLVGHGAQVFAITPPTGREELFAENGIEFVPFKVRGSSLDPIHHVRAMHRLTSLLRALRPHLLQTFAAESNVIGGWAARRPGTPPVISTVTGVGNLYVHAPGLKGRLVSLSADQLMRPSLRRVSAVVFQNPDDRNDFLGRRLCTPEQAKMILSSGIDLDEYSQQSVTPQVRAALRSTWGIEPSETVVTMVARLLPAKGVHEYVAAARALRGRARFVIVGEPMGRTSITDDDLVSWREAGIIVTGKQLNISEWLAISDIYALPSYREGVPRANLEAMAMELPIVTTQTPGCRETVVEGDNGFLVPPRDTGALIKALRQLIEDPRLRGRMGTRSRELAHERFALDHVVDQYLRLYTDVLRSTPA